MVLITAVDDPVPGDRPTEVRDPTTTTWWRQMPARDYREQHRASTPLELFFDLCFVVAVAAASTKLEHALVEDHAVSGVVSYLSVFFAIWWAWMNFTWFASAYDSDDIPYRLLTFVQIAGVLVLAAGVPRAFDGDFTVVTIGYTVMRLALVVLWLRAAASDPVNRVRNTRVAVGTALCQVGWLAALLVPDPTHRGVFALLIVAEIAVPVLAGQGATPWHPGHIAERFSLFTLIVLGETVLATTVALGAAFDDPEHRGSLTTTIVGGLLIVFGMWWKYFARSAETKLTSARAAFTWGYGHYLVFTSAAAVGAGLVATIATLADGGQRNIAAMVTVPVVVYTITVWALQIRRSRADNRTLPVVVVGCLLIAAATFTGQAVLITGFAVAGMVVAATLLERRLGVVPA